MHQSQKSRGKSWEYQTHWWVVQTKRNLACVNFRKDFWDSFWGQRKNWPIAERRVIRNNTRNLCESWVGPAWFSFLKFCLSFNSLFLSLSKLKYAYFLFIYLFIYSFNQFHPMMRNTQQSGAPISVCSYRRIKFCMHNTAMLIVLREN